MLNGVLKFFKNDKFLSKYTRSTIGVTKTMVLVGKNCLNNMFRYRAIFKKRTHVLNMLVAGVFD